MYVDALVIAPRVHTLPTAGVLGATHGAAIWVFMNAVVWPLSHAAREPFLSGYYLAFLTITRRSPVAADLASFPPATTFEETAPCPSSVTTA